MSPHSKACGSTKAAFRRCKAWRKTSTVPEAVIARYSAAVVGLSSPPMKSKLTLWIFVGMALGILAGHLSHEYLARASRKVFSENITLLTEIFLRLIKMLIAPLVLSTLIVGIGRMDNLGSIGRVGLKAAGWFLAASLVSLSVGLVLANLWQPGLAMNLPLPDSHAASGIQGSAINLKDFVTHLVPSSVVSAMAGNEILQIAVFSVFFGVAASSLGQAAEPVLVWLEALSRIILKMANYVMAFAPFAGFASLAHIISDQGLSVLVTYARFIGEVYVGFFIIWGLLIAAGTLFLGKRIFRLLFHMRTPMAISFSTSSSEAAYPSLLLGLERFGVDPKIANFVLPMGYSFNLDGAMLFATFSILFIAQAYHIQMGLGEQLTMLLLLMVTSKGVAGVPRAIFAVMAATLPIFHLPEAGLLLVLGIDHILDMGRATTNAIGNSVAAASIAAWESKLGPETTDELSQAATAPATAPGRDAAPVPTVRPLPDRAVSTRQ